MPHRPFSISSAELSQLIRAWLAVSLAFGIMLNGGFILTSKFLSLIIISAVTVGIGFLLHEMAHKVVALRYGCRAEFRSFDSMLILAIIMSFFGFVFAAPGAVFIEGRINDKRNGIISAAGPMLNMFLALVFLTAFLMLRGSYAGMIAYYGLSINSWLAVFNMLPLFGLDGTKILKWSKGMYFVMIAFSFGLMFLTSRLSSI